MTKGLMLFLAICQLVLNPLTPYAKENEAGIYEFTEPLYIEVYIKSCKMVIYRVVEGELEEINELPVATVREGIYLYPKGLGQITEVVLNPSWAPTKNTIAHINQKSRAAGNGDVFEPNQIIKPNDPRNAMGTFKMFLSHSVPGKGKIYRIHGNNKASSIGKRASSGCVRADNKKGYILAQNIKKRLSRQELVEVDFIEM